MLRKQNQPLRSGTLIPFADGSRKILAIRSIVNIWFRRRVRPVIGDCRLKSSSRLTGCFRTPLLCFALRNIERVRSPRVALGRAVRLAGGNLISALFALVDPSRIHRLSRLTGHEKHAATSKQNFTFQFFLLMAISLSVQGRGIEELVLTREPR